MKRIFAALTILATISSIFAIIFCDKTLWGFSKMFLIATVAQFIIQYIANQYLNAKYGVQVTQLEATMAKELNRNVTGVACPCYIRNVQDVDLNINGENRYICNKCNKEISVNVALTTAISTTPVDNLKAEVDLKPVVPVVSEPIVTDE